MDGDTPRTLLSSLLKHSDHIQTLRRLPRDVERLTQRELSKSDNIGEKKSTQNDTYEVSTTSQAVGLSAKPTPRALISGALLKNNIQKTVRIPLRQAHPSSLKIHEKDNTVCDKDKTNDNQVKISTTDSTSNNHNHKSFLHKVHSNKSGHSKNFENLEHSILNEEKDESIVLHHKKRVKRLRLSDLKFGNTEPKMESDAFADDLVAKIDALIKNKKNRVAETISEENAVINKVRNQAQLTEPKLSSTKNASVLDISSYSNSRKKITRKDAGMNTLYISAYSEAKTNKEVTLDEKSNQGSSQGSKSDRGIKEPSEKSLKDAVYHNYETIEASTTSDISSKYGPLELSAITEEGHLKTTGGSNRNLPSVDNTRHSTPAKSINETTDDNNTVEDSDIWPDSMVDDNKNEQHKTEELFSDELSPVKAASLVLETQTEDILPMQVIDDKVPLLSDPEAQEDFHTKIQVTKKQTISKKRPHYDLPLPKTQLYGIVQHFSSLKFSREAFGEIEELTRHYFNQTATHLEEICMAKKSKKINAKEMIDLMKSREYITKKKSLNVLVEENLPMEYREELLEVAIAGNRILP